MIRKQFESYLECKKWLDELAKGRERFFYNLPNTSPLGISYEEFTAGSSTTHDQRMAVIADEMLKFDKEHQFIKSMCQVVIKACDQWFILDIKKEYKNIFWLAYLEEERTLEQVAKLTKYERSWVTRIIDRECDRIAKIKEAQMC